MSDLDWLLMIIVALGFVVLLLCVDLGDDDG
jgi:hypothetical protein